MRRKPCLVAGLDLARGVRRPACSARRGGSSSSATWPSPMIRTIMSASSSRKPRRGPVPAVTACRTSGCPAAAARPAPRAALDGLRSAAGPPASSAFIRCSSSSTSVPPESRSSSAWMSSLASAASGRPGRRRPAVRRWRRPGPAAAAVLSSARWIGHADVAHLLGDAGEGLADPGLRLGRGVGGLDGLLLRAEGVHLGLQPLGGQRELLLLALQRGCCVSRSVTCCWRAARRDSASRARSSRPSASALRPWSCSLDDFVLELVQLQLQPLAGRGATSATPRRTFCSSSSCFWYE